MKASFCSQRRKGRQRRFALADGSEQETATKHSPSEELSPVQKPAKTSRSSKSAQDRTRERNRIAAQQCRWRLKKYIERLECAQASQEQLNSELLGRCSELELEQQVLRGEECTMWQFLFEHVLPTLRQRNDLGDDAFLLGFPPLSDPESLYPMVLQPVPVCAQKTADVLCGDDNEQAQEQDCVPGRSDTASSIVEQTDASSCEPPSCEPFVCRADSSSGDSSNTTGDTNEAGAFAF